MSLPAMDLAVTYTTASLLRDRADDDHVGYRFEDQSWTWGEVVRESVARSDMLRSLRIDGPFHVGVLLGDSRACYHLGVMHAHGCGFAPDAKAARTWLAIAGLVDEAKVLAILAGDDPLAPKRSPGVTVRRVPIAM